MRPWAEFHTSIHIYFYCWICNGSKVASLGNFVWMACIQSCHQYLKESSINLDIGIILRYNEMYNLKYRNTVSPVKKFRLYFVIKHFGFIDGFRNSRFSVSNGSDNNTHICGRKNGGRVHRGEIVSNKYRTHLRTKDWYYFISS